MPPVPPEQASGYVHVRPLAYRMRDAERVSGVSKSKLYQLAADGKLKLTRVGGRTLVPDAELQRLITEGFAA